MRIPRLLSITLLAAFLLVTGAESSPRPVAAAVPPSPDQGDGSLLFVENVGQFHPQARFQVRGSGVTLWLTEDGLWITLTLLPDPPPTPASGSGGRVARRQAGRVGSEGAILYLSFPGANPHPRLEPFDRQETVVNYYRGNDPTQWHTHVPAWGRVRYVDLYPGVDLEITGRSGRLVWRLVAQDGRHATGEMRLRVEGANGVAVEDGWLRLETSLGTFSLPLPTAVGFAPADAPAAVREGEAAFEIASPYASASADNALSPQATADALLLGTYIGGTDFDTVNAIAVDDSGAVYVTGATLSTDFPTEGPGATSSLNGNCDLFITKLGWPAALFRPIYSTYLGGSYNDSIYGDWITETGLDIAVEDGAAYVAGFTWSDDFPTTAGAYDTTFNGPATSPDASPDRPGWDGVVVKLDAGGNLAYATYLGGSGYDIPGDGRGGGDDEARGIAVRNGVVYVTGYTLSSDFPTTAGAFDRTYADVHVGLNEDVFVTKLNPAGNGSADLLYSTFVGGGLTEKGNDIVVDEAGLVYVTGYAHGHDYDPNMNSDFPTTPGAFDTELKGDDWDAFLLKMNPAGNGSADLLYSTFLGTGAGWDYGHALAVDGAGYAYIVGSTDSPDFPTTAGAFDTTCGTDGTCNVSGLGARDDAFLAKLNPAGGGTSDLLYATFLGGSSFDSNVTDWADIVLDDAGDVYLTGLTYSDDFPVTADAYDDSQSGYTDAFVARLRLQSRGQEDLVYATFLGGYGSDHGLGIALESRGVVWVAGETDSSDFPTTSGVFDRYYNGGDYDGFIVKMAVPPASDLSTSAKVVTPNTAAAGEVVTFTVTLANSGLISAAASFTDTLPAELVLQGTPAASSGSVTVNGQTITWQGTVDAGANVLITYATLLTSTTALTPTAVNEAYIDDGQGNVYLQRAFVNGHQVYLPLVLRGW